MRPIVIDSGDEKAALAKRCGAEAFIDFRKESDVAAKVVETADGVGAHGVMVTAWQSYKGRRPKPRSTGDECKANDSQMPSRTLAAGLVVLLHA